MKQLWLTTNSKQVSRIFIGTTLTANIKDYLKQTAPSQMVYVTDSNLLGLLKQYLNPPKEQVIVVKAGEANKTLLSMQQVATELMRRQVDKNSLVVGFGGGMITDLVGLTAAVYMRGVPCVFIPTSLIGMVDAAIGGKSAVDFNRHKNLLGTIRQPQAVFIDTDLLKSLPQQDLRSGLGEIMRTATVFDKQFFAELEEDSMLSKLPKYI